MSHRRLQLGRTNPEEAVDSDVRVRTRTSAASDLNKVHLNRPLSSTCYAGGLLSSQFSRIRQSYLSPNSTFTGYEMASLKLEFEKGGTFIARLLEDEAPKTCDTLKSRMPFEYLFQQSIVSGQAMVAIPPDLTVEKENQRVAGIPPGALSFLVAEEHTHVPDEIYIAYGVFISRGLFIDAKQPVNVFAQIDDGLEELREIGARIIRHGAEMVRFTLAD